VIIRFNPNTTNINKKNGKQISFGAGKVDVYSDFDRTYLPVSQSVARNPDPETFQKYTNYFAKFKKFLDNTREGLKFHITSGRTFGEFETIAYQIKESGFKMPLPDTYIAKNGSDQHIRVGTDEDFYTKGKFPFKYEVTNKEKENAIKTLTNWDGQKFKAKIIELLKKHDFRIVEHDSENSVKDYGDRSLFAHVDYDKFKVDMDSLDNPPQSEWVAGLRKDGNLKIYLSYPTDMNYVSERKDVYNKIGSELSKFLTENNYKILPVSKSYDRGCGWRPVEIYTPKMDESYRYASKSKEKDFTLTKLYDTKEAVKRAIKNNDLVIVAGDSSNDFNMLNPILYIDLPEGTSNKIEMMTSDPEWFMEALNLDPANEKDAKTMKNYKLDIESLSKIQKQIEDLPFVGIVVKNEEKHGRFSPLNETVKAFGPGSKFPKIIEVEPGHLEDGVRQAIKMHAEKNPEYAKKLSPDLKKEILGIVEKIKKKDVINVIKKKSKVKFYAIGAGVIGLAGAAAYYLKRRNNNQLSEQNKPKLTIQSSDPQSQQKLNEIKKQMGFGSNSANLGIFEY